MATTSKPIIKKKLVITKKPSQGIGNIGDQEQGFKNTKEKGDAYEEFILAHLFKKDSRVKAWLWPDIP